MSEAGSFPDSDRGRFSVVVPVSPKGCNKMRASPKGTVNKNLSPNANLLRGYDPLYQGMFHCSAFAKRVLLWMDEILHHFGAMGNHFLLVFTGNHFARVSEVVQDFVLAVSTPIQ